MIPAFIVVGLTIWAAMTIAVRIRQGQAERGDLPPHLR